jgi:lipopolysaccharide export system permease protein
MKTIRRLFYRDILASVGFVATAFVSLFYFIDIVDDLDAIGRRGRAVWHVALAALYEVPSHVYDLLPIAVLIGTIYSLARMAQASEYTILRTSGLGPGRALRLLALLGVAFGALNFVVGDFVVPAAERASLQLAARFDGVRLIGGAGAWLKEKQAMADGEHSVSINVGGISASGVLEQLRGFEFDHDGRLVTRTSARDATVAADGTWTLRDVHITSWPAARSGEPPRVSDEQRPSLTYKSSLDAAVVTAAVLPLTSMTTADLWRYSAHLDDQAQATQQVKLRFWKKALYPLSCLVMVALALPFAYLQARAGGISLKVFGGIMLGITFVLLNDLAGHIGMLSDWTPWVVASAPSLLFLLLSLGAFAWLVRYR